MPLSWGWSWSLPPVQCHEPPSIGLQAFCLSDLIPWMYSFTGYIMVESSDKTWSTGEGNCKPLKHSCLENPMNSMKRQKDLTLKGELSRSVGAQYATGEQWRNNSRKNEETEPEWKQYPVVYVNGDGSKVRCYKECCVGTWNVRSMNQGKLEVVKQEMARVNFDMLEISEIKWTRMDYGVWL